MNIEEEERYSCSQCGKERKDRFSRREGCNKHLITNDLFKDTFMNGWPRADRMVDFSAAPIKRDDFKAQMCHHGVQKLS